MNFSIFKNSDAKFLSQAADPVLRKKEIARLKEGRLVMGMCVAVLAVLYLACKFFFSLDSDNFLLIMLLFMYMQLSSLENGLRLLLLADQIYAQQNRLAVGAP